MILYIYIYKELLVKLVWKAWYDNQCSLEVVIPISLKMGKPCYKHGSKVVATLLLSVSNLTGTGHLTLYSVPGP